MKFVKKVLIFGFILVWSNFEQGKKEMIKYFYFISNLFKKVIIRFAKHSARTEKLFRDSFFIINLQELAKIFVC